MRRIILYINSTFNGVVTGDPKGNKDNFTVWTNAAYMKAGTDCLLQTMQTVDTLLMGRNTYKALSVPEGWRNVKQWGPSVSDQSLALGDKINNAHKVVVTGEHPLEELTWGEFETPTQLTGNDIEEQIEALKNSDGGDIIIFGSPTLVRALTDAKLIDEYQIQIAPVVVPVGDRLFDGIKQRMDFELVEAKTFDGGSMRVKYKPAKTQAQ